MSGDSLQDSHWPQSRKRPSPALASEISDYESEDPLCRLRAQKAPKLSEESEDEPMLDTTHCVSGGHNENISCYGPLARPPSGLVPLACMEKHILNLGESLDQFTTSPGYSTCFGMVRRTFISSML